MPAEPGSRPRRELNSGGEDVSISLHEATPSTEPVRLRTPYLVYYGVVDGRMTVHTEGESKTVEPGGSVVVPPLQSVVVDVPDTVHPATHYLSLKVDRERVQTILDGLTETPRSGLDHWTVEDEGYCCVEREEGVHRVLRMLAYLFRSDPPNRDRLIDLNVRELTLLLLQTPARPLLVGNFSRHTSLGGLAAVVQYIQDNLDRHISIDELVDEACMSKSSFYRHFSDEFDMSPLEFITQERIVRARELLSDPDNTVTSVSHALGFSSTSHFIDMFKEHEGMTPKQYQLDTTES